MNINENIDPHGGLPLELGPYNDFDMFYNPRIIGNIVSSDPGVIKGLDTEYIDDEYFHDNIQKKRKKRKKIKKFKEFEGAGFGHTDYMNVTNATSSGYLNDNQPINNNNIGSISTTLPRGNWTEPSTIIVGFKNYQIKDPFFLKKKEKNKRLKRKKKKEDIINMINNLYI